MTREQSGVCGRSMAQPSQNVAQTLLFRHITPRKRFDSADFAMGMDSMGAAGSVVKANISKPESTNLNQKKESVNLAQALLTRHRDHRQRFDSADFAIEKSAIIDTASFPPGRTGGDKQPLNVAKKLLSRHMGHRQRFDSADYAMGNTIDTCSMKPASESKASDPVSKSDQPLNVAKVLLKRHLDHRQRFDSADYAMEHPIHSEPEPEKAVDEKFLPVGTKRPVSPLSCEPASALFQENTNGTENLINDEFDEMRPQQVRRIRLQRFDSADWMLQQYGKYTEFSTNSDVKVTNTTTEAPSGPDRSRTQQAVAKLLLERHAYKTCHFVNTPVYQRFVEQA